MPRIRSGAVLHCSEVAGLANPDRIGTDFPPVSQKTDLMRDVLSGLVKRDPV